MARQLCGLQRPKRGRTSGVSLIAVVKGRSLGKPETDQAQHCGQPQAMRSGASDGPAIGPKREPRAVDPSYTRLTVTMCNGI
jgi:hypothetical protein